MCVQPESTKDILNYRYTTPIDSSYTAAEQLIYSLIIT